jgi:hypothetical protein
MYEDFLDEDTGEVTRVKRGPSLTKTRPNKGKVFVKAHTRKGKKVAGHFRKN